MKLYQWIAQRLAQIENLRQPGSVAIVTEEDVMSQVEDRVKKYMPSGSGFDAGTQLDWDRSTKNRLVFTTEYHHMDEHGGYDGWTTHDVIVKPDLCFDFTLRITGRDRNQIKDYIYQEFNHRLLTDID